MTANTPSRMRAEIGETPAVVARILDAGPELDEAATAIRAASPRWVTIVARGTSDHAAVYAQYLLETQLGLASGLAKPSVTTVYRSSISWAGGMVLAISQSGQSPDVVAVVRAAREAGALTLAITNDEGSPLAMAADHQLSCHAGPELAVPATKTYVAQLAVTAALVSAVSGSDALRRGLAALPERLTRTLETAAAWLGADGNEAVEALAAADRTLVLSRGYNLATALELALKLKETVGLFAEAYSTADFAHGPRVLTRAAVPILAIRPDGPVAAELDATLAAAVAAGGRPILIGGAGAAGLPGALALPFSIDEPLSPIVLVVPGQLLVEAVASRRGVDPDAPAGLDKVTRTH